MSHNGDSPESNGDELPQTFEIAIVQIRTYQGGGGNDETTQGMLQHLLSARSFRLERMTGDDTTTSWRADEDDNDRTFRGSDPRYYGNLEDEDYDDGLDYGIWGRPHATTPKWFPPVTEPQEAGLKLLKNGEFGRIGVEAWSRKGSANVSKTILSRRSKLRPTPKQDITNDIIPNSHGTAVASLNDNIYCGQYSADSSFYYTCCRDFRLHIYDMTAPLSIPARVPRQTQRLSRQAAADEPTTMKVIKVIQGVSGGWTITDAHLSPDNERIIYSSIDSTVHMATTLDPSTIQIPICFADPVPPRRSRLSSFTQFGIWSCKFSADGNEVIAGGGSTRIQVYDLLANRRTVKIDAHHADVNSCCWADSESGNVLVSGSDDTFVKVWDRRSLGSSHKPSGVLIGHTEGITNVSAKGDGRYVISNGKDQMLRLWDLRKMRSNAEWEEVADHHYGIRGFNYRYGRYPKPNHLAHPLDCSVMTYRGHAVLQTLIRCHFSPVETTGGRYIYSGSADGRIHIWSLDGRVVQVLDRSKTLPMFFDPSASEVDRPTGSSRIVSVRDVSWHSKEPVLMSAAWSNGDGGSIVARHEWKGLLKIRGALEDHVEKRRLENIGRQSVNRSGHIPSRDDSEDEYMPESESDEDD
ncbi:WD40-repeat-containing domain protein [Russula earlei]|uniref:WD40-repeat-containing domain protein n=1 Tax=Russula earlei TaxID=71964 RepID=A0ACC0U8F1_9AGAM|nr:WD40-repeat-containing domain protein [Russula earlei]